MRWPIALLLLSAPASAQIVSAPPAAVDQTARNAAAAAQAAIPTPATAMPPAVSDTGSIGTQTQVFALANHTHASKARKVVATTATDGTYTFSYAANPFVNAPTCLAVAETAAGVTDVINVQIVGTPTTTSVTFLANRTQRSVAALLGLTVLSVPAQPGSIKIHAICLEP